MTGARAWLAAIGAGIAVGLVSTWPVELGPAASLSLWALCGAGLGVLARRRSGVVTVGAGYGVALTVTFLYSRFGGTSDHLGGYTIFVLAMSLVGILGGVASVAAGHVLRHLSGSRQR